MNEKRHGGPGGRSGRRSPGYDKHGNAGSRQTGKQGAGAEGVSNEVKDRAASGLGGHRHGHRHPARGGRRGGRLFDYGELRLLILALIANGPSHGYELIKTIEDRFAGAYSPSPGVIYPTLAWLEDMGYASIDTKEGGRKQVEITKEGAKLLKEKKEEADALFARAGQPGRPTGHAPAPVVRAMENLKTALRLRLRHGPVDEATVETIAAAIDAAAREVERAE